MAATDDHLAARRRRLRRMKALLLFAGVAFSVGAVIGFSRAEGLVGEAAPGLRFLARAGIAGVTGLACSSAFAAIITLGEITLRVRRRLDERLRAAVDDKHPAP